MGTIINALTEEDYLWYSHTQARSGNELVAVIDCGFSSVSISCIACNCLCDIYFVCNFVCDFLE